MKKIISSILLLGALFCLPQAISAQVAKKEAVKKEAKKQAAQTVEADAPAAKVPVGTKPVGKVIEKKVVDGKMKPAPKEKPQPMVGRRLVPKPGTKVNIGTKIEKKDAKAAQKAKAKKKRTAAKVSGAN